MADPSHNRELFLKLGTRVKAGNLQTVQSFVRENEVQAEHIERQLDSTFPCPVCLAAKHGFVDVLEYLITVGFAYNLPSPDDHSLKLRPIHLASYGGHLEIVRSLVEKHEIDVNTRDAFDNTPLYWAMSKTNVHMDVVRYLSQHGADMNVKNKIDNSSLLHVSVGRFGGKNVCEYLLSRGADVTARAHNDNTPLHDAVFWRRSDCACALLESGADVNARTRSEETPFHCATKNDDLNMLKLLTEYGADPEMCDSLGSTSLHLAAMRGSYEVVKYLCLELNADPNVLNKSNNSAIDYVLVDADVKLTSLLIEVGATSGQFIKRDTRREFAVPFPGGVAPDQTDAILELMNTFFSTARTLQHLCAIKVRRILGRQFPALIDRLPLPDLIRSEIKLCF